MCQQPRQYMSNKRYLYVLSVQYLQNIIKLLNNFFFFKFIEQFYLQKIKIQFIINLIMIKYSYQIFNSFLNQRFIQIFINESITIKQDQAPQQFILQKMNFLKNLFLQVNTKNFT
eukprot:TRINITY_DN633_c0_g1_i17.p4 TRINITY_DN633_c0_g1~~TRINITY_DN633_c0_g1_i17.p4  ORF type:complete len:115 (-),score=10.88 TRINITY_DN633_c0_g1_i17:424-768(-)